MSSLKALILAKAAIGMPSVIELSPIPPIPDIGFGGWVSILFSRSFIDARLKSYNMATRRIGI